MRFANFYETKSIVADVEILSSGQNLYMKYKLCMSRYGRILELGGGVRMANSWSGCVTCVALEINVL